MKNSGMTVNDSCRICGSKALYQILDFGEQPLANAFVRKENLLVEEAVYPLRVFRCSDCGLVQLIDVVQPEMLFSDYIYFSSGMPSSSHFKAYAEEVTRLILGHARARHGLIVEIGSNDGHFLSEVKSYGARVLGVDPAANLAEVARARGIEQIVDFFGRRTAEEIRVTYGPARVVVANNVVAHINDLADFVFGVAHLLDSGGVFIMETPYLLDMFENLAFDSIYHEHLSYFSLRPLVVLFARYGLEIMDVKVYPVQGSSLRIYAVKRGSQFKSAVVRQMISHERLWGLDHDASYFSLRHRIGILRDSVRNCLFSLLAQKYRIAAYGAPARGNTLLNYFGIDTRMIEYATEALPSKIGLYTPGTHIPIVDIEWARNNPPDYYLLLAWNYKDVILKSEQEFLARGGKFIMPVGYERIIPT